MDCILAKSRGGLELDHLDKNWTKANLIEKKSGPK